MFINRIGSKTTHPDVHQSDPNLEPKHKTRTSNVDPPDPKLEPEQNRSRRCAAAVASLC
ncbi:hypothetical protein HanIR_Chr11g0503051 [Helianthus annuus]|nr:hypothetical protein HanIR_Chr11g0503051 [Helianthus annuus]